MRMLAIIVTSAALAAGTAWAWFSMAYPSYTHRYRLTVEVELDGKVRAASSVIEVNWKRQPQFPGPEVAPWAARVLGQAALLDLGSHGALIAALRPVEIGGASLSQGAEYIAVRAFNPDRRKQNISGFPVTEDVLRTMSAAGGSVVLDSSDQPQLIWLSNINDPSTAQPVSPEDFSKVIHPSARLGNITIEMTTSALGTDLEQKLPWLTALHERQRTRGIRMRPGQFYLDANRLLGASR